MPDPLRRPVIFDLDGTVWDSAPGIVDSVVATLAEMGLPNPAPDRLRSLLGPPLLAMLTELGVPSARLEEGRAIYRRHYREQGEFRCEIYAGLVDLLDRLRSAGHATATATSKGVEVAERMLRRAQLIDRFDVVEAASMTQAGHTKIDVIGEAMAGLEAIGLPATEAVMVGDRSYDIEGGQHFGLVTIGVGWGYANPGELVAAGADHVVDTVGELADLLLGPLPGG